MINNARARKNPKTHLEFLLRLIFEAGNEANMLTSLARRRETKNCPHNFCETRDLKLTGLMKIVYPRRLISDYSGKAS